MTEYPGEEIEINFPDDQSYTNIARLYIKQHFFPESHGVFEQLLDEGESLNTAIGQSLINEQIIEMIQVAIKIEESKEFESMLHVLRDDENDDFDWDLFIAYCKTPCYRYKV